jgi:hypothetical protein
VGINFFRFFREALAAACENRGSGKTDFPVWNHGVVIADRFGALRNPLGYRRCILAHWAARIARKALGGEQEMVDVNQRLVWSRHKLHRKRLWIFALGTVAAAVVVWIADSELERWGFGIAGFVFLAMSFYDIYKMYEPNSALIELLPQGIIYRVTTEDFIVPWSEIKGVETTDIHTSFNGRAEFYPGVTVILVSRLFYDRVVHVDTLLMRGPGWGAWFLEKDADTMLIALHHHVIPASAETIRLEVEERWKVFGNNKATPHPGERAERVRHS